MTRPDRALIVAALALALVLSAGGVGARVEADSEYTKAQTYSGALRYLRVDLGFEVVEKDSDAAYLVFRYEPPGQQKNESLGTVEIVDSGEHVRVFVRIPRMPEYHERVLRDGLLRKLKDEYGPPLPRKPEPPPKAPGDAGPGDAGTD
ncbi:MAG TPA: hypothetical protein VLJ38_17295 [Polyangiaceae bacterium]|nr:hypothetical protein [Polyangiaceae bacterium]